MAQAPCVANREAWDRQVTFSSASATINSDAAAVSQKAFIPAIGNSLRDNQCVDARVILDGTEPAAKMFDNDLSGVIGAAGTLTILCVTLYLFLRYLV